MTSTHTDIAQESLIEKCLPAKLIPYSRLIRLDRPIGMWLLLLPSLWGLCLGAETFPPLLYIFYYGLGALLMRGAGCLYNDLVDLDLDKKVTRTQGRPLPSGQLTKKEAFVFLIGLLGTSFLILIQLPILTIGLGGISLVLVFTYPWMKRWTYWPQAFLGMTFNWGVLMGWTTVQSELTIAPLLLYGGGIFWTLFYDTIYAHQDRDDDELAGIKSSALKLGHHTKPVLLLFALLSLSLWSAVGWITQLGWIYQISIAFIAAHFCWQIFTLNQDEVEDCLQKFRSNKAIGFILLAGILGARWGGSP